MVVASAVACIGALMPIVQAAPLPADGLALHLDAAKSGSRAGLMARWEDLTGKARHVAQADHLTSTGG